MEKERLTREQIKQDILALMKKERAHRIFWLFSPITLIPTAPFIRIILGMFVPEELCPIVFPIILILLALGLLAFPILFLRETLSNISKIKNDRFYVFTEKLLGKQEAPRKHSHRGMYCNDPYDSLYLLYFSSCDRYRIPRGMNYKWSKLGGIPDYGVYRGANVNDTFILASTDSKRVLLAYNANLFKLVDEP